MSRAACRLPAVVACLGLAGLGVAGLGLAEISPAAASSPATAPTLSVSAASVANGATVTITFATPPKSLTTSNWIGIYSAGQTPGNVASTSWQYAPTSKGTVTFATSSLNGAGSYDVYYLYNNSYRVLAGPVSLTVTGEGPAPAPRFTGLLGATGPNRLAAPYGVAVGSDGTVWVADQSGNRVEEFSPAGRLVRVFGNSGPDALDHPQGIAIGPDGSIWVSDTGHDRIVAFWPTGRRRAIFGASGSGKAQLSQPEGLTVGPLGSVYVADHGNNRVEKFGPGGGFLTAFPVATPVGVAVTGVGNLWVSSASYAHGNSVQEFGPDGSQLVNNTSTQAGYGALSNPAGIAVGPDGRIYVTQPDYGLVTVLNPDGSFFTEFGVQRDPAQGGQNLLFPHGVAVGPDNTIWVADTGNGRVVKYVPARHAVPAAPPVSPSAKNRFGLTLLIMALFLLGVLAASLLVWWLRRRRRGKTGPPPLSGGSGDLPGAASGAADADAGREAADADAGRATAGADAGRETAGAGSGTGGSGADSSGASAGGAGPAPAQADPAQTRPAGSQPPATEASSAAPPVAPALAVRLSRRTLLSRATALSGAAVGAAVLPLSLRQASAAALGSRYQGSISDIQHIVILMQEGRSFDHYFGTMPGVRNFADPKALRLPTGHRVFYQPDHSHAQGYLLPFRYDTATTSAQATPSTDHSWTTQHHAWNGGKMDAWVAAKGPFTLGYFAREDIPFHWALAESFTICDNYHSSVLGPTNPNRLYMWTGMIDPKGTSGGPVIDDTPAFNNPILSWTTYPERLTLAGVSWRVYQEEDNFDNNALAWFKQYAKASSSSPLRQNGLTFGQAGDFEADARAGRLPQVSWLVAPTAQSEHPSFFPAAGAEYIAQKLDAIAANPSLWATTAFILCYAENDGLFDHVVPPTPRPHTTGEYVKNAPIGLGFRTPTTIVSPWTVGGNVCSEVFDHTSLIRFIEARFGVMEPNISAYRRATCGDLTSAFRFSRPSATYPAGHSDLSLPVTESRLLRAQIQVASNPGPAVPEVNQPLPRP